MTTLFDRKTFFDSVRKSLFSGSMNQSQVDGLNFILDVWEDNHFDADIRWCANSLAQCHWEVGGRMVPVREGFKNTDAEARAYVKAQGYAYAVVIAETGQVYYGRGLIQNTWDYNYKNATAKLGLTGENDLYWYPERALDPKISADCMFVGMMQGWYRPPNNLPDYFSGTRDDPFNARDIVNGDKNYTPDWLNGGRVGDCIADYHKKYLTGLQAAMAAYTPTPEPEPEPEPPEPTPPQGVTINLRITVSADAPVNVTVEAEHIEA
jgi:putative chitinase